ncbi:TonB-dependent receptor [Bacteroides sp. 51]|nr:TonB-dependent receptor [Bacteroides sp. 51]
MLVGMLSAGTAAFAQSAPKDSLQYVALEEVQIVSTRATSKTPVAFTDVNKEQINKQNFGLDIPFLLTSTPSVLTTSDAGSGVGYTSIRVRGTDATRINITTNGIPMNDAESHSIYWVNTPDIASSLEDMQIQRGAGTSTNGAGAFGASINMRTQGIPSKAYAEVSGSYGSFNTNKETFKVGTGLLHNHWAFDARVSNIQSDGYRDRATSDLKSYFLQGGYYGENTSVKLITFGGKEQTYHAWDGISKDMLKTNRRYNPNGKIKEGNEDAEDAKTIGFYDDQMDNYRQTHYQLLVNHTFSPEWNMNVALHYTDGYGYYQEYKNGRTLKEYGLTPYTIEGVTYKKSNLVRQKLVESDFGGGVFSFNYRTNRLDASVGGGLNYYTNDHYGKVLWVKNYIGDLAADHEYYRNTGRKTDGNIYAKANYDLGSGVNLYADMQYRYIKYKINGNNDKWDFREGYDKLQRLDINEDFNFFNPKAGLFWQINRSNSAYASFGVAQKEPSRNNYTDGGFTKFPKPEKMFDYELGYTYRGKCFTAGANLYYMDYTDQLVLNGRLNEIGEPMAENVKDSYRMGLELTAGAKITPWLRWDVNATWSKNRIKNYVEYVSDYNESWDELYTQTARELGTTPIAFSPSFMAGSLISFSHKGWEASFQSQYVSRQYLDNAGVKENSLDAYFVSHLHAGYTFNVPYTKGVTVGATVYNIFNKKYETNGYSQTAAVYETDAEGNKVGNATIYNDPRYYPMAGTNVLFNIALKF